MTLRFKLVRSLLIAASASTVCTFAAAQTGAFELFISGSKSGKASYKIEKAKYGFKLTGRYQFKIPQTPTMPTMTADFTDDFKLNDSYAFLEGQTEDHSNYAHHYALSTDKQSKQLTVASYSGTLPNSTFVEVKPGFLVLVPLDPATSEAVLLAALTHPSGDGTYTLFVADPAGGGGGSGGHRGKGAPAASTDPDSTDAGGTDPGNDAYDARVIKGKDSGGMLDGKVVLLHTYLLAYGNTRYVMYADADNNLMQINAPALKASYIRAGFKLNAPGTAAPTPASPAGQ